MKSQWKPIDTAPINNKLILLYDKNRRGCGDERFTGYRVLVNKGMEDEEALTMDNSRYDFVEATHWMPCPPIP